MTTPPLTQQSAPGIYPQEVFPPPPPTLLTGVPAFLGYASTGPVGQPQPLTLWPQFAAQFGDSVAGGFLAYAVRGFFENGGLLCYVVRLDGPDDTPPTEKALLDGLAALQAVDAVDLICAPDIMKGATLTTTSSPLAIEAVTGLQKDVLDDCRNTGGRFAILDALLTDDSAMVQRQRAALTSEDGALYHPWLWAPGQGGNQQWLPPCGHVAGIYSRTDQAAGVQKAPANATVEGVLDLRVNLAGHEIGLLYADRVNFLRALRGRGIRVWGARTLSQDTDWQFVPARRVFLTMGRWLERFMAELAYEPNDVRLWVRIMRELTAYLDGLFQLGALNGATPEEAFFVKCDSETNPPEVAAAGMAVTVVGVALAAPTEFVVIRIIHGASGVSIQPASATA
jgi:uncharacterized protein